MMGDGFLQIIRIRHAIFNFSTNIRNENSSLSEDWDLGIFDCRLTAHLYINLFFPPKQTLEKIDTICHGNGPQIWPQVLGNESPGYAKG